MNSKINWSNSHIKLDKEEKKVLNTLVDTWLKNVCDLFLAKKNKNLRWKFGDFRSIKALYLSIYPFNDDVKTIWYEELNKIAKSIWWETIEDILLNSTNIDHLRSIEQLQNKIVYRKHNNELTILDVARVILEEPKLRVLSREKLSELYAILWEFEISDKIDELPEKDLLEDDEVNNSVEKLINTDPVSVYCSKNTNETVSQYRNRLNHTVDLSLSYMIGEALKSLGIKNVIDFLTTSKDSIENLDLHWWYDLLSAMSLIVWQRIEKWEITDYILKHVIHKIWWLSLKDEIAKNLGKKDIVYKQDLLELNINKFSKTKYYKDLRWIDLVNLLLWQGYKNLDKIIMIDFAKRVWLISRFTDKKYIDRYLWSWKTAPTKSKEDIVNPVIDAAELFKI